jgi:hypothetical protein
VTSRRGNFFHAVGIKEIGTSGRARTCDPLIKSQLLCQLSYACIRNCWPYVIKRWSERRDSNPRQPRWQRGALPLSYSRVSSQRVLYGNQLPSQPFLGLGMEWERENHGSPRHSTGQARMTRMGVWNGERKGEIARGSRGLTRMREPRMGTLDSRFAAGVRGARTPALGNGRN